ncbi:MAG: hypothetical protein MGG37_16460 [Trichodesmium sp. MAG_R01]|nr:hypothetical protein [Trichodesmium sp. MAG_R01]
MLKAAKLVVNHPLKYKIGRIVFGYNKQQKDGINIGAKNNHKFVQILTAIAQRTHQEIMLTKWNIIFGNSRVLYFTS